MPEKKKQSGHLYFRLIDGEKVGPINSRELKKLADSGKLRPNDLILRDDQEEPVIAKKFRGLFVHPDKSRSRAMSSSEKSFDVFISHSSRDYETAIQLVNFLEVQNLRCWIAPRDIVPGSDYNAQITRGIKATSTLLVIESRHSAKSEQVLREIDAAASQKKPVIPVKLELLDRTDAFKHLLRTYQWIDASEGGFDKHYSTIATGVQRALGIVVESDRPSPKRVPDYIGKYRVVELIEEGGMGAVFKAEQRKPIRRTVAIKRIKLGLDTKEILARFESERQALARMDHPSIAKVLDAGSDEIGKPFFVMEYVPGMPITEFADANKLSIRERLGLFIQVCQAIAHAHSKAIIHRDIKPGNILAYISDCKPMAKVIDFGVAKALTSDRLTDRTFATQRGFAVGTYEYMSPEQADGSPDIDTRTDVYSLGALLYELLTGYKPFESESMAQQADSEIRRVIKEVAPPRPSSKLSENGDQDCRIAAARSTKSEALASQLKSELEWIPLYAMRKERERRYATTLDLAEDVENYLKNLPLQAGPETTRYRLGKFFRRNRIPIVAASLVILAIVAGSIGTTLGMFRAESALQDLKKSRKESQVVWEVIDESYSQVQDDQIRHLPGLDSFHEELAAIRIEGFERLLVIDPDDIETQEKLARALYVRGSISAFIGKVKVADDCLRQSAEVYSKLREESLDKKRFGVLKCRALGELSYLLTRDGSIAEGKAVLEQVVAELNQMVSQFPEDSAINFELAKASYRLGFDVAKDRKKKLLESAKLRFENLLAVEYRRAEVEFFVSSVNYSLFFENHEWNDYEAQQRILKEVKQVREDVGKRLPESPFIGAFIADITREMAWVAVRQGNFDEASQLYAKAQNRIEKLIEHNPDRPLVRNNQIRILSQKAQNLQRRKKYDESLDAHKQSIAVASLATKQFPDRPSVALELLYSEEAISEYWNTSRPATVDTVEQTRQKLKARTAQLNFARESYSSFQRSNPKFGMLFAHAIHKRMTIETDANDYDSALPFAEELFDLFRSDAFSSQISEANADQIAGYCDGVAKTFVARSKEKLVELGNWLVDLKPHLGREGNQSASFVLGQIANNFKDESNWEESIKYFRLVCSYSESELNENPWHWYLRQQVSGAYMNLAEIYREIGDHENEVLALRKWLEYWHSVSQKNVRTDHFLNKNRPLTLEEADQIRKEIDTRSTSMKRFTIPCDFNGVKYPFHVYITDVRSDLHPLEHQAQWLKKVRGGTIPQDVMTSFDRLQKIAIENNVSFVDLCVYALGTAAAEEGRQLKVEQVDSAQKNISQPTRSVASKIPAFSKKAAELKQKVDNAPENPNSFLELAQAYEKLANELSVVGKPNEALGVYEKSVAFLERSIALFGGSPKDQNPATGINNARDALATILGRLAEHHTKSKDVDKALSLRHRQFELIQYRTKTSSDFAKNRGSQEIMEIQTALGNLYRAKKDNFSAVRWYLKVTGDESIKRFAEVAMTDPSVLTLSSDSLKSVFLKARDTAINLNGIPDKTVQGWNDYRSKQSKSRTTELAIKNQRTASGIASRADSLRQISEKLYLSKQFGDAIKVLLEEYQLRKSQVSTLNNDDGKLAKSDCEFEIAKTYAAKGDSGNALKWMRSAARTGANVDAMFELAAWLESGEHGPANQASAKTIKARALGIRGMKFYRSKDYTSSIEDFKAILDLDPKNIGVMSQLAMANGKLGSWDEAIPYYKEVWSLAPQSSNGLNLLEALVILGETQEVESFVEKLIESNALKSKLFGFNETRNQLILLGLLAINERAQNESKLTGDFEQLFYDFVSYPRNFKIDGWSFDELGNWLVNSNLSEFQTDKINLILSEMNGTPIHESKWFPLQVGFKWMHLSSRSDDPNWSVPDQETTVKWLETQADGFTWRNVGNLGHVVVRPNGIYRRSNATQKPSLLLPFNSTKEPGALVGKLEFLLDGTKDESRECEIERSNVKVPAGEFENCKLVVFKDKKSGQVLEKIWFAEGIGPVKIEKRMPNTDSAFHVLELKLFLDDLIVLLSGLDSQNGKTFTFVKVTYGEVARMRRAFDAGEKIDPLEFGVVVESGVGTPTKSVQEKLKEQYGRVIEFGERKK